MMNNYDMMPAGSSLLWIVIGFLLVLLLVAAVTWLLARWRNEQRLYQMHHAPQLQDTSHIYEQGYQPPEPSPEASYEQGYQPPEPSPEASQEGGHSYSYPQPPYEQPTARHPQEIPLQQ